jgi:type I restriction enzyme, S subunit
MMIGSLGPYPEMRELDHRSKTGEERLLSLRMRQGLVDHIDAGGKPIPPESLINFKIVEPGQVVMNRMRAAAGLFGVASLRGLVSPDYAVFEPKPEAFTPYLLQAFRLPSLSAVFRAESKGLGTGESGFLRLYTDRFGPIPVPYPPLDEQRLIVRFLDWHGSRAARLIRAKRKLIALLNEEKQAIIHRAVTRGLDPHAKLKSSGVPWLGDVPQGWEVGRLKTLVQNKTEQKAFRSRSEIYVALEHIESWSGRLLQRDFDTQFDSQGKSFAAGDILFGKLRPYLAKVTRLDIGGVCVGELLVLRPLESIVDPAFLECRMRTSDFIGLVNSSTFGAKMPRADWDFIGNVRIAIPRSLGEQRAIVSFVQNATGPLSLTANRVSDEIALIQEFRTRLIADVVTGKLDVRALAATLPETVEIEPVEEPSDDDLNEMTDEPAAEEEAA